MDRHPLKGTLVRCPHREQLPTRSTVSAQNRPFFEFEDDVDGGDLWFQRDSNDLVLKLLGHEDSIRYVDWYNPANAEPQVFAFKAGESYLTSDRVDALVTAMASFTPNDGSTAYGIKSDDLPSAVQISAAASWRQITA